MKTNYTVRETSTVLDQIPIPWNRLRPHFESEGLLGNETLLSDLKLLRQHSSARSILSLVNKLKKFKWLITSNLQNEPLSNRTKYTT